ncbi:MAG TPA: hypothetical protein VFG95_05205, partial [Nitrospiria bacterium]|nr:hypothetical protein [Nitrospiria bacterium]
STHPSGIRYDGYYAEASVEEVLWDLFDSGSRASGDTRPNKVGLGFTPIYQVMVGGQKTTPAFTSVFSFLKYLKAANAAASANIAALAAAENITAGDEYEGGAGQKIYTAVPVNGTVVNADVNGNPLQTWTTYGPITAGNPGNKLNNRMFFKFTIATAGSYTITVTPSARDVFFTLNEKGTNTSVDNSNSSGSETLTKVFTAGTYTVEVGTFGGADTFTVKIQP